MKVRDQQVANRPFYAAIGVTTDGHKDVPGLWAGNGAEGYAGTSPGGPDSDADTNTARNSATTEPDTDNKVGLEY